VKPAALCEAAQKNRVRTSQRRERESRRLKSQWSAAALTAEQLDLGERVRGARKLGPTSCRRFVGIGLDNIHSTAAGIVDPPRAVPTVPVHVGSALGLEPWPAKVRQQLPHLVRRPALQPAN